MKITKHLPAHILLNCFLMIQYTIWSCDHDIAPLPCWKHPNSVLFYFLGSNILPISKSLTIFNPSMKLYIDFSNSMGIDDLKLFNVPCKILKAQMSEKN
jgi:hypothetical protein